MQDSHSTFVRCYFLCPYLRRMHLKTIKGKYAEARIFTDESDEYAEAQVRLICDSIAADGSSVCVMPDLHPGKVGPIGLAMTVTDKIIPQLIGVDIGCGVTCVRLNKSKVEFQKLDRIIRENIPSGFDIRKNAHHRADEFQFEKLYCLKNINRDKAEKSLGTLGGGNHFIEIDRSADGTLYLTVHSGSRHTGEEVAEHYTKRASIELKEAGLDISYYQSWLTGRSAEEYIHDVRIMQKYAELNRDIIISEILKGMKLKAEEKFSVPHNYIDDAGVLHKGSISAREGEQVIIPVNMRDGVILGMGKGNEEWNCSAPHGSGRIIKRSEVKNTHTVSEFRKAMNGIYSSCLAADTLDEAPFAYRSIDEIAARIHATVEITDILTPVYSYKAGSGKKVK